MKNKESGKKINYGKYLFLGVLTAVIILFTINYFTTDTVTTQINTSHIWSAETDSQFVKNCFDKYRPQIKDDLEKQDASKKFCRCMLEKVKLKYEENDLIKIKDFEIKKWDAECRESILNPGKTK